MEVHDFNDISNGIEVFPVALHISREFSTVTHPAFTYVKTNIPGPGCDKNQFSDTFAGCSCGEVCSPHSCSCMQQFGCAYTLDKRVEETNLALLQTRPILECGVECSCSTLCRNKLVRKGVTRPYAVYCTDTKGFGLKTTSNDTPIHPLEFVCEYAGEVVGEEEARRRVSRNEKLKKDNYLIALREHVGRESKLCTYVDPSLMGNLGRFINHSCDPNLIMVPVRVSHQVPRLALFARREIGPDEELTFDYSGSAQYIPHELDQHSSLLSKRKFESDMSVDHLLSQKSCSKKFVECDKYNNTSGGLKRTKINQDKELPEQTLEEKKTNCTLSEMSTRQMCTAILPKSQQIFHRDAYSEDGSSILTEELKSHLSVEPFKDSERSDPATQTGEYVHKFSQRKACLCKSLNCQGYLPFDEELLIDQV